MKKKLPIAALVQEIAEDTHCTVFPASGLPHIIGMNGAMLPVDLIQFYSICGGLIIGKGMRYETRIVAPHECQQSNYAALGRHANVLEQEAPHDISWHWYNIADIGNGDYLSIDLSHERNGWCYDSFHETYGLVGEMPIIAGSFTELLTQLYRHMGQYWYWLQTNFRLLGDAYSKQDRQAERKD
jgi:antitoxin YokJ